MKENNRTINSTKNVIFALGCQFVTLLLSFVNRSFFIKNLSATYLGLNGVFSNVIYFLSLAELGIGNVLLYNLYKPLKDNDNKKIVQILNLFKKLYTIIAIVILVLGILVIPLLPYILNGIKFSLSILIIYLLFLTNTVASYLFTYKMFLLTADQKDRIVSQVTMFTVIIKEIIQILILILFKNFYLYLIVLIITTLMKNIILSIIVSKKYDLKLKVDALPVKEKKRIFLDFRDIFFYKFSNIVLYGTDNLLMSMLLNNGTIIVGIYSNYLLITNSLKNVITPIFQAMTGSIGNLNASDDIEKKYTVFKSLNFIATFIYGLCSICLFLLLNPFINIFAGKDYLFTTVIVVIIVIYFYVEGTFTPSWIFRETAGIFRKSKNTALVQAILNVVLSIVLGLKIGIVGILGATIISRLLTTYFYEPFLIVNNYLNKSFVNYLLNNLKYLLRNLLVGIVVYFIFRNMTINNYFDFLIYGTLIFTLSLVLLIKLSHKDDEFKFLTAKFKFILNKVRRGK